MDTAQTTKTPRRLLALVGALGCVLAAPVPATSLRFYGNGVNDIDRVKIRINSPAVPADIGAGDFTIEFWMRALADDYIPQRDNSGNPTGAACQRTESSWINGNIILDRALWENVLHGDFGVSLFPSGIAVGVFRGEGPAAGAGLCGTTPVNDGQWHHVAVTRDAGTGNLRLFVDGRLQDQTSGPTGDISYRNDRELSSGGTLPPGTDTANVEPFLILGAEKYSLGDRYPSYSGWLDELRLSNTVRYTADFPRPSQPFASDADTVALWHFDEGGGSAVNDSSGAPGGPSHGELRYGSGTRTAGPVWSSDSPFGASGAGSSAVSAGGGGSGGGCTLRSGTSAYGDPVLVVWIALLVLWRWQRCKRDETGCDA
jgi:hypothetical protein